ncbi:MAG: hypothetical protein HYX97_00120 [Chloroflexi bacterium]|nr:hypothetical protein [Chloroflexota bacterium]
MTRQIRLEPYVGSWLPSDQNANFRREVAEYSRIDPLPTLEGMSNIFGIPVGALAGYVLAKWAASCGDAILYVGPKAVHQMADAIRQAEADGTDQARMVAYYKLSKTISWLEWPLVNRGGDSPSAE